MIMGEATPNNKGIGVADPYLSDIIHKGQSFWLCLDPSEIGTVRHVWDHKSLSFNKPSREIKLNACIESYASDFGVHINN